jgi:hypothetical protein
MARSFVTRNPIRPYENSPAMSATYVERSRQERHNIVKTPRETPLHPGQDWHRSRADTVSNRDEQSIKKNSPTGTHTERF